MPASFDRYGLEYESAVEEAIAFAGQPHDVYVAAKARKLVELARRRIPGGPPVTLDVGCGIGLTDRHLVPFVRSLEGADVSEAMVVRAREANPEVEYRVYDGRRLPYEDAAFDLVFAICVLHHVPTDERQGLVREMARVTRPRGLVAVFEHNPWNPLTRRVVRTCAFDEDAELLARRDLVAIVQEAGLEVTDSEYILFFPWRRPLLEAVERGLGWIPLGAQYLVAARPAS